MSSKSSPLTQWALGLLILFYSIGLLVFTLTASQSRLEPGPRIQLGREDSLKRVPPDFTAIDQVDELKQRFFGFMRPLISRENAFYAQERARLARIMEKQEAGKTLSWGDKRKLAYWRDKLAVNRDLEWPAQLHQLQLRLNTIPESMVLAQAAMESAWGRSRFAREAYNYFGQWCYTPGCGLVPRRRDAGADHEVRRFNDAQEAVRSYFHNINSHRAYLPLRKQRLRLQQNQEAVTGVQLVGNLLNYSQRREHYVRELRQIIRGNDLEISR